MRVLNLYSGLGGNRKLWTDCEVTAVELDPNIAEVYKRLYPDDTVIVGDAHNYLVENYKKFDFIWSSPPCPSHSRINFANTRKKEYPDMKLYQEIIFLNQWFDGYWVVENVIPYYKPLIDADVADRHLFWSSGSVSDFTPSTPVTIRDMSKISQLEEALGIYVSDFKLSGKRQKLRNCVHPETGLHVFNSVIK